MTNQVKMIILGTLLAIGAGYGACVMTVDDAEQELGSIDTPPFDAGMPELEIAPEIPEIGANTETPPVEIPPGVLVRCGGEDCAPGQGCCATNGACVGEADACAGDLIQIEMVPSRSMQQPLPEGVGITCAGTQCESNQVCCPSSGECVSMNDPQACPTDTYRPVLSEYWPVDPRVQQALNAAGNAAPPVEIPEGVLVQCGDNACAPGQACCGTNSECVSSSDDCAGNLVGVEIIPSTVTNPQLPEGVAITCAGNTCDAAEVCCPSTGECVDPNDEEACDVDTFRPVPVAPTITPSEEGPAGPMPPPIP